MESRKQCALCDSMEVDEADHENGNPQFSYNQNRYSNDNNLRFEDAEFAPPDISSDTPCRTSANGKSQVNNSSYRTGTFLRRFEIPISLYTYLAGCGTHPMHSSSPAVDWREVPNCVYDAHLMIVGLQSYAVSEEDPPLDEFNQNAFIAGNRANGTCIFRQQTAPIGYTVFGASVYIEVLVGNGEGQRRTTKQNSTRRAEMLLAHGDVLLTNVPLEGDAPIEVPPAVRAAPPLM
ncbi:hypothetical protein CTheo_7021 [Ceratobasidium theobromae]|uniref:Uncharacterized protein n=1 Tax=Ceratobasidium theobromae TaxID=1582974 RepID=A0A5N5QDM4_9AGAM|nr:hypothetical protein CTheo_7021 [Ceratobasidium theobromae]